MEIQYSEKAKFFKPNIFNILNERKAKIAQKGVKVYDLFVGTPDFPPAEHVMKVVQEAALNPENYKYSLTDTQELKDAVKNWYDRRYDVTLNDDEIMSINGSQEGFAHVAMTVCNPGDLVLVPNPGYPIFEVGPYLNDASIDITSALFHLVLERGERIGVRKRLTIVVRKVDQQRSCLVGLGSNERHDRANGIE